MWREGEVIVGARGRTSTGADVKSVAMVEDGEDDEDQDGRLDRQMMTVMTSDCKTRHEHGQKRGWSEHEKREGQGGKEGKGG